MPKIEFDSNVIMFDYILRYASSFKDINTYIFDHLEYNFACEDDNKYIVNKKIGHVNYDITFENKKININYTHK